MASYPPLLRGSSEPAIEDLEELRLHRKRDTALGYRCFGALRYGQLGDGHISARDPILTDHFWLLGYGVPFRQATVKDLVLVAPDGSLVIGSGDINIAAYYIHAPIHQARQDIVSVAHVHSPYGTPWSANVKPFEPISQESCAFVFDQVIFDDEELDIVSLDGGRRIADAMGAARLVILRNHGLLTVGATVSEAVGWYVMAERVAEVHVKAPDAIPISTEGAKKVAEVMAPPRVGRNSFQWLIRDLVPDPSVVG
jgi:ribulose-5-phosphate 4-epimerase/fuculose-1-phosphate aldolase